MSQGGPVDFSYDPFDADGDGKPVAVLPNPARSTIRCTTCRSGTPSRCPASRTSGGCWKSTTGHSSRRKGPCRRRPCWQSTTPGRVDDPPLHPLPFHAVFDTDLYGEIRRAHSAPLRPRSVAGLEARIRALANERLDLLLPRGSFDLTQEYGGIVAASMVCGLLGLPDDLAPQVLAAVNAGSLAEPGVGVDTAEARPNYLEYLRAGGRAPPRRPVRGRAAGCRRPARLPAARRQRAVRRRGRDPDALHLHRWHGNGAQDRRPRAVGAQPAARPVGRGARRPRDQRADRARGDDPVLRAGAVVRPNCA